MTWSFEFSKKAQKQLNKLDGKTKSRIKKAIYEKLIINPQANLIPLCGDFVGLYKFRVGSYRLLCAKNNDEFYVLVVKIGHRKQVYKN